MMADTCDSCRLRLLLSDDGEAQVAQILQAALDIQVGGQTGGTQWIKGSLCLLFQPFRRLLASFTSDDWNSSYQLEIIDADYRF